MQKNGFIKGFTNILDSGRTTYVFQPPPWERGLRKVGGQVKKLGGMSYQPMMMIMMMMIIIMMMMAMAMAMMMMMAMAMAMMMMMMVVVVVVVGVVDVHIYSWNA